MLLTALTAVGQFASSVYLPSLPAMAVALTTDLPTTQLTLTLFLVVFAVTQLVCGPVSDRFGRRYLALLGLVAFILGSAVGALAPDIAAVFVGRALQAVGAAASTIAARAAIRDCFDGPDIARVMALTTMVFGLVPGLAPLLGGALQDVFGWTATMWASAVAGALVLAATTFWFPETIQMRMPALNLGAALSAYAPILRSRAYLGYAAASALGLGSLFAFLSASPAVYINHLGASATEYGLYPPFGVTAFVVGAAIARRLAGRFSAPVLIRRAYIVLLLGTWIVALLPQIGLYGKVPIMVGMVIFSLGFGVVAPTGVAAAVAPFADRAGTAAALIGFLQLLGSAVGTLVASALDPLLGPIAFPVAMALLSSIGGLLLIWLVPRN